MSIMVDLVGCARCHGDGHPGLKFQRLAHPVPDGGGPPLTHWAPCPTNGQPILMSSGRKYVPTEVWVLPRPRKDAYVGSWPWALEQKLDRLLNFPEKILLPFSGLGGMDFKGQVDTVDSNPTVSPTYVGDAHDMNWIADETYDLVLIDPPYSDDESYWLYGTGKLHPGKFKAEAVRVCKTGGLVGIYHVRQPSRPEGTKLVQRVVILTRTGHTPRLIFLFEKMGAEEIAQFEAARK